MCEHFFHHCKSCVSCRWMAFLVCLLFMFGSSVTALVLTFGLGKAVFWLLLHLA